MAFLRSTLLLYTTHLFRLAWTKRVAIAALVALGPAGLALLIQRFPEPPTSIEIVAYPGWYIVLQLVIPLISLLLGSAVVSEEIDDRTITYLFTRPFPRAALLVGRWLATATVLVALVSLCIGGLALCARFGGNTGDAASLGEGIVGPLYVGALLGALAYSALFAALGTFVKYPMIVGLAYSFAIEGVLANFPGKSQSLTILFHVRSYVVGRGNDLWMIVKGEDVGSKFNPPEDALTTIAIILAVALTVGSVVITRRQYLLTA